MPIAGKRPTAALRFHYAFLTSNLMGMNQSAAEMEMCKVQFGSSRKIAARRRWSS
jgi:hypothetical protein